MNKKNTLIFGITFLVILIVGYFGYIWANRVTDVVKIEPVTSEPIATDTPIDIQNIWIKTKIPPGFKNVSYKEDVNDDIKLQSVYSGKSENLGDIAITIKKLPADGLSGVADYNMRTKDSDKYQQVAFGGWPEAAKTFILKSSGYETTAFWVNGNLYAMISASGPDITKKDTNTALSAVLDQWQWY